MMKRILLSIAPMLLAAGAFSQFSLFQNTLEPVRDNRQIIPSNYRTVGVNFEQLKNYLLQAPHENTVQPANSDYIISLPHPNGETWSFRIAETPLFAPELQTEMPYIRTYTGQGVGDKPYATVKLDFTPKGFHAMVLTPGNSWFIDPYSPEDTEIYISYTRGAFYDTNTKAFQELQPFNGQQKFDMTKGAEDTTKEEEGKTKGDKKPKPNPGLFKTTNGTNLRTYMLALACTGEYAAFHGGTVALVNAAYTTTMNRVNGVFERDMAIRMQIVAGNNGLIFLNSATDPYTNNDGGAMLGQNITTCGSVIGNANFDIGHVFSTGGGGVAYLAGICNNALKAGGVTGQPAPVGDPFDIDYVAHEMGHQYGANHTQNNNCNRNASTAYEPGSASTIMGYAGICAPNLQNNSDDYFHNISFNEMFNYNVSGFGNTCATITATGNTPPTVTVPAGGWVIPISTPFELTATGADANGDAITYCWEEFDLGPATSAGGLNSPSGNQPIFRSWDPETSPTRVFPRLSNLVNNTVPLGELLPTYDRTLTFRCTVRDNRANGGGVVDAQLAFTVDNIGGPFVVTAPNTAVTWAGGSTQTVTWNVANTTAAPISCSNVDIWLSYDGGFTYPTLLLANTPNDGTQTILVPGTPTTQARIKVKAANNIFFDISNVNFTITAASIPGCTNPTACNYNPAATTDNGSCTFPGCTNPLACNYDPTAACDSGGCTFPGCNNVLACNYNPAAGCNDGSCIIPSYTETFADGNFTANPVWTGDTGAWQIVASADAGTNSASSNSLRLNFTTAAAGTQYLSTAFSSWQNEQDWSFWVGRRAQAYNGTNTLAIWLYADQTNLESATINGYRILVGDGTGVQEYRLQRVVNGTATTILTTAGITAGLTDHSGHIRVTRSSNGTWTFYTSTLPTANGQGPTANACVSATVNQGTIVDNNIVPSGTGYFGLVAVHANTANARAAVEFDNFTLTTNAVTPGCTDIAACNYNPAAMVNDGSCTYPGCTNAAACNYNPSAGCSDGSCIFPTVWFADADGDGYGNPLVSVSACTSPPNFVANSSDCNDLNSAVNPAAVELPCNGLDDNCNSQIDENATYGCTNTTACNYNASANCDDGSCTFQTYYDSFTDGNFSANPVWTGDTGAWQIVASADAGTNSTNSQTLRLNFTTAAAGVQHLSTPFANWQNEQDWSFWVGRRAQAYNANNTLAIWLYADQANLESATINGYRILIGDGTGVQEYRLQRVVNGTATTIITTAGVTAGVTDHSNRVRVTRSSAGVWTFYTTTLATANGQGPNANICPNPTINQGTATDNTFIPSGTAHFGLVAVHNNTANGRTAVEFDNLVISTAATVIPGCTNPAACNYNPAANQDNGSCVLPTLWFADADGDGYGNPLVSLSACSQPANFVAVSGDCNDLNNAINPGAAEIPCNGVDDNCNTQIDENNVNGCTNPTACNYNPAANCDNGSCTFGTIWFADADGDFYGNTAVTQVACTQPLGYVAVGGDCNDLNAFVNPGNIEVPCNGEDDNCNGQTDENNINGCTNPTACNYNPAANCDNGSCDFSTCAGCTNPTACNYNPAATIDNGSCTFGAIWFADADGDTYGNAAVSQLACTQPVGYVAVSGDCDDNNAAAYPGATEIACNGIDDDCDGIMDETNVNGCTNPTACNYNPAANCDNGSCTFGTIWFADADGDFYGNSAVTQVACTQPLGYVAVGGDCNDLNAFVNPGNIEVPCNGEDDNCNGQTDENNINGCTNPAACNYNPAANCDNGSCTFGTTWFADSDGDGFGTGAVSQLACTQPVGYVAVSGDCDDNNAAAYPGATEIACNGIDDDCDGIVDETNVNGCTNPTACNYNPAANCDNGSCEFISCGTVLGCTIPTACNYNPAANTNDGSCQMPGCYDPFATNYNPFAPCGGGVCVYEPTPLPINASAFPACNPVNGTTGTMDPSGLPANGPFGGNPNDDVLYAFNLTNEGAVKVVVNGTGINAVVELWSGSYAFISSQDGSASVGGQEVLFQDGLGAGTYVVRVYDFGNGAGGNFNICISTYASSRVEANYINQTYGVCDVTKCTHVPAANGYEWIFEETIGSGYSSYIQGTNYTFLTLSSLVGTPLQYGMTYNVTVGAGYNDPHLGQVFVYGSATDPCVMQSAPSVQLATSYIGGSYQLNQQIKTGQSCNAEGYVWRLTPSSGPALADVTVMGSTYLTLCSVAGILPGQTYGVQIAVIYNGVTYGFGPSQNIQTAPYVPVTLRAQDACESAGAVSLSYTIYANVFSPCASDYTWEFTPVSGGLPFYKKKGNGVRTLKLSTVPGLQPGENYIVRVKAEYGNFMGFNPITGEPMYDYATAYGAADDICLIGSASAAAEMEDETESVFETAQTSRLSVYPNPAKSNFNINISARNEAYGMGYVRVVDMFGKEIFSQSLPLNGADVNSNIHVDTHPAAGVYTIHVTIGTLNLTDKLVVTP